MRMDEDEEEEEKDPSLVNFKKVFVNATILDETGDEWGFEEGCLSIPGIRGEVFRPEYVKIHYWDERGQEHEEVFEGFAARIIQHEYDHIEGKLFIDHITPLQRRLLKKKLDDISFGKVRVDYRMLFPK